MKIGRWSPAAGSNNEAVPDGWPEGQLPSTVNDCAREMMASIRTMLLDAQFVDQGMTPTYITALSFSVPGNQTSAIQIGRRLKIFDATAGVQQIIYATVTSVSFTAVTTVHIESDSGSLTSSLSSFGISIISNNNNSLPRQSDMTISSLAVTGALSISGAAAIGGAMALGSTLSVSATATAAVFKAPNTAKAYISYVLSASAPSLLGSFNIASISRSAIGVVRITFSSSFATTATLAVTSLGGVRFLLNLQYVSASVYKVHTSNISGSAADASAHIVFYNNS
jgi:hypothetical protein